MIKLNLLINAWETLAPDAVFAGMTLTQFKAAVKAAFDKDAKVAALKAEIVGEKNQLNDVSSDAHALGQKVVRAVRGDIAYGIDCPLYAAMGYIRESARKSGLTVKGQTTETSVTPKN